MSPKPYTDQPEDLELPGLDPDTERWLAELPEVDLSGLLPEDFDIDIDTSDIDEFIEELIAGDD